MSDGLTLEKQRVVERLEGLERSIDTYIKVSELQRIQDKAILDKLSHIIIGNGEQGLVDKVRNLDRIDGIHSKHYFVIYTSLVSIFIGAVWKIITNK